MSAWSMYRTATGEFTGMVFAGDETLLDLNTPAGCAPMPGGHDHLSRRVDLATGQVIDWQPAAPADTEMLTYRWSDVSRRWLASPTLAALRLRQQTDVTAEIERVEAGQPRALREAALASDGSLEALRAFARLAEIDAQIAALRQSLAEIEAAPDEQALYSPLKSREAPL